MNCDQPGCPGTVIDGYCDVCGMPPGSAPVVNTPAPQSPARRAPRVRARQRAGSPPSMPRSATQWPAPDAFAAVGGPDPLGEVSGQCPQPGCPGQIVDGYCNVCGNPPTAEPTITKPKTGVDTPTASSRHLGSTPMGSSLVVGSGVIQRPAQPRNRTQSRIGAGLTYVPPAPAVNPEASVMKTAVVPEHRRFCAHCNEQVGRGKDGEPGPVAGACPACGTAFNFEPSISSGEMVAGQYEVAGPIAYGGMGWIYLARDRNVSDRWVVLKGLLNAGDADATAAARAEQQNLARVEHPLIVEIYNFVTHQGAEYIVMEYVPGRSLTDLLKQRREANGGNHQLPLDWALAYVIEVLPALTYLHENELLYCDFKPDNLMQVGDSVKLIDLGSVRRIDDDTSPLYGTVGFQAPEVGTLGPSVASDVYTLGRTLMVLSADVPGYQSEYAHVLPPANAVPLFAAEDSFYRFILRCCAPERADRFQSIEEVRNQAFGVLREVTERTTPGAAYSSAPSAFFEPPTATNDEFNWRQLPTLRVDSSDAMAGFLSGLVSGPAELRFAQLRRAPQRTPEIDLEMMRTAIIGGKRELVDEIGNDVLRRDPWQWRAVWLMGVAAMMADDWTAAIAHFNAVYGQLPGELAPKFALAVACERDGERDLAEQLYAVCATTDANYVTASAFGLARLRSRRGDRAGIMEALGLVPGTSSGFSAAQRIRADRLLDAADTMDSLSGALVAVRAAQLDVSQTADYEVRILSRALQFIKKNPQPTGAMLADVPATEAELRSRLEQAFRHLAVYQRDPSEHNRLIEQANTTRKWSLL